MVYLTFLLAVALPLPLHPCMFLMFLVCLVSSLVESQVHLPPLGALLQELPPQGLYGLLGRGKVETKHTEF